MNFETILDLDSDVKKVILPIEQYNDLVTQARLAKQYEQRLKPTESSLVEKGRDLFEKDMALKFLEQEITKLHEQRLKSESAIIEKDNLIANLNERIKTMEQAILRLDAIRKAAYNVGKSDPSSALQSKIHKQSLEITRLHAKVKELEGKSRPSKQVHTALGVLNVEPSTIIQMANDLAARLNPQPQLEYVVTSNGKYEINATTITSLLEENTNLKTLVTRFKDALKDIPQF